MSEWRKAEIAETFLRNVRGAMPGARLQLDVLGHLVRSWCPTASRILDLGCGDGILGRSLAAWFPDAEIVLADFSAPMLEAARKAAGSNTRIQVLEADFSTPAWLHAVGPQEFFDVVVSGFAIHHQPDERKQRLYAEIFERLAPSGLFLNLEHVASLSPAGESLFDEFFVDHLWDFHRASGQGETREKIAAAYYHRPDKIENLLAPVEAQCRWLRTIGFSDVDCFLKIFELALFGGRKTGPTVAAARP